MAKILNFSDKLRSIARANYKTHSFLKEWQVVILLLIILKFGAMLFSIFAGYSYLQNFFFELLNDKVSSIVFTVLALVLVEGLVMYFLSKLFKFALRLRFKTAILPAFGAVIFFSISFILSTNGLALRQSNRVDNTEVLTNQYNDKVLNTNVLFNSQLDEVRDRIRTIKQNPQGWKNSKRIILLDHQLKQIDLYYSDIKRLNGEHKVELNNLKSEYDKQIQLNASSMTNEADKYYLIVSVIMAIIFVINGLLMYLYGRIWAENEKEQATNEVINTLSNDIETKATGLITDRITDVFNMFFSALAVQFEDNQPRLTTAKKAVSIGFQNQGIKPEGETPPSTTQDVTTNVVNENRKCKHCGKEFIYKTWNQIFCSSECRVQNWEQRTGRKVIKGKK